jgi:hypothetical protein
LLYVPRWAGWFLAKRLHCLLYRPLAVEPIMMRREGHYWKSNLVRPDVTGQLAGISGSHMLEMSVILM